MHVRDAIAGDALAIETIRVRGWRAAYRHILPGEALDALPIDETRWRRRIVDPPPGWAVVVAQEGEHVVGFAATGPSRDEEGIGELYAMYVDPARWSTGAGRALLERAESGLRARHGEATLWVLEDNGRARRFWERAGWTSDGGSKTEERFGVQAAEIRYRKRFG